MPRKNKAADKLPALQMVKTEDIDIDIFIKNVKRLKKRGKLDKPCYIFGADYFVKLYIIIFSQLGINIAGILDNNPQKWGRVCGGVPIAPIDGVIGKEAVVLVASGLWRAMSAQLEGMGLKEDTDYVNIWKQRKARCFQSFRDLLACFGLFVSGTIISGRILRKYGADTPVYFLHLLSYGDMYITARYLPAHMGCSSIAESNCVIVVLNKGNQKLAKSLGFKNVELIKLSQRMKVQYANWASEGKTDIRELVYSAFPSCPQSGIFTTQGISFSDMFYPYLFANSAENKVTAPTFHPNWQRIEKCFVENGLADKKTVVISPYTISTISEVSSRMWETIVRRLKENGYCVCTNSAGPTEPPIEGTNAVFPPFEDSVAFLERAGGFIAARNGLCDIASSARCTKVIIYETAIINSNFFFSINRMGLCDDAVEYDYDGIHSEELIDKIMRNFPPIE